MRGTVATELYLHATPHQIASAVVPGPVGGGLTLALEGSWHATPWIRSVDAWRHNASWRRGRTRGAATIDVVAADHERTLVIVTLSAARPRSLHRPVAADAAAIARCLRTAAEHGGTAIALPRTDTAARVGAGRPRRAAVGYSRP